MIAEIETFLLRKALQGRIMRFLSMRRFMPSLIRHASEWNRKSVTRIPFGMEFEIDGR